MFGTSLLVERPLPSEEELNTFLSLRVGEPQGYNLFFLRPDDTDFPCLSMFVEDELAYVYYLPAEGDAGFSSVGNVFPENDRSDIFYFRSDLGSERAGLNKAGVVHFRDARQAAQEFFTHQNRPEAIDWFEL